MNNKFLNQFNFKNQNVFLLGGSGLIGTETANLFIELNANLIILDKNPPSKKIKSGKYNYLEIDLLDLDLIDFEKIFKSFGSPDVFVNTSYPRNDLWKDSSFKKINLKNLRTNIDLHLNSYAWTAKIFADQMVKKKKCGSIVLMSSIYGFLGQDLNIYEDTDMTENATYSIIKSGIINYCKQMASYYGQFGIRVNSISSGGLYGHHAGSSKKNQDKIFLKNYSKKTPLSRLGYPEEIANAIVFLTSKNSSYTTGANFIVDGGISSI